MKFTAENLSGKQIEVRGKINFYSLVLEGIEYKLLSDEFNDLRSAILPSASTLINPGIYTLDENGKLPKKANDKMITSWDDDGHRKMGENTTYYK